ncbi:MAG: GDSL-type esterase/lipase family protein [Oscillospiraceae bacterium]|nr:GDSL-type esterase/lipase family protein [Oscillospiraceae bacterium]
MKLTKCDKGHSYDLDGSNGCPFCDGSEKIEQNTFDPYFEMQRNNKYFGKRFSVMGDSISTLYGYNPPGYALFYEGENCDNSGVNKMEDTWWGKLISYFGGELLVNNSWSGSRVTRFPDQDELFPSGCSGERTGNLHIDNVKPDVVIIYLGTNDWDNGVTLSHIDYSGEDTAPWSDIFLDAYEKMILSIKENYPNAEVWCCTLNSIFISSNPSFSFPESPGGVHIEKYNEIIRSVSLKTNCGLIDLYKNNIPHDTVEGLHPTADGMSTMAMLMIRRLAEPKFGTFMDCKNDEHEFIVADTHTDGTKYVCTKCGKESTRIKKKLKNRLKLLFAAVGGVILLFFFIATFNMFLFLSKSAPPHEMTPVETVQFYFERWNEKNTIGMNSVVRDERKNTDYGKSHLMYVHLTRSIDETEKYMNNEGTNFSEIFPGYVKYSVVEVEFEIEYKKSRFFDNAGGFPDGKSIVDNWHYVLGKIYEESDWVIVSWGV